MNKKALAIIIAAVVIIIGAGTAFALTRNNDDKTTTTARQTTEVTAVSEENSTSEVPSSQEETSETSTTQQSTTAEVTSVTTADYSFIKKGVWYYFDDTKREAYAFKFDGDDDVDITYYNSDNVDGNDTQTASGEADYTIANGMISIDDIPSNLDANSFTFTIDGNSVKDDSGKALEKKDKARLEYAFDHFNQ